MWVQNTTPEFFLEDKVNLYFKAIQQNRLEDVKSVVSAVESVEIPYLEGKVVVNQLIQKKSGDTGLHVSATHGFLDIIKYLVEEKGANLEQVNKDGKTALHDAAQFSQNEVVKYLLERGSNVNVVKRADWTPLMLACTKQDACVIKILLEQGAYPFFVNKDGWNCCHIAAREGNLEIVKMLLNHLKPDMRRKLCQSKSRNGRRPLHTAVMHGHLEVSKLLVQECSHDDVNEEDHCGTTPLMEACRFGYLELINYLVENTHANPKSCNKQGLNCLHIAAEAGQCSVIELLILKHEMDINLGTKPLNMTSLHWAAKEGQLEASKTLLELGAERELLDSKGRSPKDVAVMFGHRNVAEKLLFSNAKTETK